MEVNNIIICDSVENVPGPNGNVPKLVMPYSNIVLNAFPNNLTFTIFITLEGLPSEPGFFDVNFYNPNCKEASLMNFKIPFDETNMELVKEKPFPNISLSIDARNYCFAEPGKYVVEILFGEKILAERKINIHKAK
ncbi:MAG: hypothetical protein JJE17_05955 [Peptostreptococcaceae bacterium]|nr:hypothetical protein [Peptostreptococcaceae bacterium]